MKNLIFLSGLSLASATLLLSQVFNVPLNQSPSRIVGHPQPEQLTVSSGISPNLVEGREMWGPGSVALDTSATPPIVYVSDTLNNRVLAWKNATGFTNGQPADLIIGQPDAYHTTAQGPGHTFQTGLSTPTGVAVSSKGDLYVADSGNNRILRYPKPFANLGNEFPDLYIGQPNLNSGGANETGSVAASGISINGYRVGLAFDSNGNLWIADPGNARVLEFAASDLAKGGGPLSAVLEIGQLDFISKQAALNPGTVANLYITNQFFNPAALAFDPKGRLFVTDTGRILVFQPPFSNNMGATRIMGLGTAPTSTFNSQTQQQATIMNDPEAVFFISGGLNTGGVGVVDAAWSRIMLFDAYDNWPDPSTTFSPQARSVLGQNGSFQVPACPNGGTPAAGACTTPQASAAVFNSPEGVFYSGTELYIADSGNNRMIVMPLTSILSSSAAGTRVLGQDNFVMQAPNLIEGREFDFIQLASNGSTAPDAGMAVDTTSSTPHLYVADTYNNRILGFKDLRGVTAGTRADIVIGQPDFNSGQCNVTGNPNSPQSYSLCQPTSVLVDSNGNLYVADRGNGRVLRFPAPFSHQGALEQADLVLGQHDFTSKITDPSSSTMANPYGLAMLGTNGLAVSDQTHNRVLFFPMTNGAFANGEASTKVFGQPDFITTTAGAANNQLSAPHHIAADTDARLYVADSANNRVLIFDQINNDPTTGSQAAAQVNNLGSPRGIYVSAVTGEFWVTNSSSGTVVKYPKFDTFILNPAATAAIPAASNTLAVTQDQYGDLVVADLTSRIAIYFPTLFAINGGNFLINTATGQPQPLTPGLLTTIVAANADCTQGNCQGGSTQFGTATAAYTDLPKPLPLPTTLGDVQVLFNGTPAPLYYVSPTQINFLVPMYDSSGNPMPSSGSAEVLVVQASTGQIYGAGQAQMATAAPAILMLSYNGPIRQAAVINQDGSINDSTHPAPRGSVISIYATGEGFVPGAPPDGNVPQGLVSTAATPRIAIGAAFTDSVTLLQGDPQDGQFVKFSGLSPQFPGIWQINVQIPFATAPGQQTLIGILMNSINSLNPAVYRTIINVGQ